MVCDKVVSQRWCVTQFCVWKMVCQRWCVTKLCVCVKDGVRQSCVCVCERWCGERWSVTKWCVKDGV